MGLYFGSPFSTVSDAHDKAKQSTSNHTTNFSPHIPGKARRLRSLVVRSQRSRSTATATPPSKPTSPSIHQTRTHTRGEASAAPTPAPASLLFRILPLPLRQKVYGYVLGQGQVLHVVMKRRSATRPTTTITTSTSNSSSADTPPPPRLAYRRCRTDADAGADGTSSGFGHHCALQRCRQFLDAADEGYYGSFDRISVSLLLSCRDIYQEARTVLYAHNALDFDHPLTFLTFHHLISPQTFSTIRSISFEPQQRLCNRLLLLRSSSNPSNPNPSTSTYTCPPAPDRELWIQMWEALLEMDGLEELRVRVRPPQSGGAGPWESDVIASMRTFPRPLKVFDVELPRVNTEISRESDEGLAA